MDIEAYFGGLADAVDDILGDQVEKFAAILAMTKGTVWIIGNGGSAANADHAANDFLKVAGIRAVAITSPSILTSWGNDEHFNKCFRRPLERMMLMDDTLLVISVSGSSPNIVEAMGESQVKGAVTLALFGPRTAKNEHRVEGVIFVEDDDYGIVETVHQGILHALALKVKEIKDGLN